MKIVYSDNNIKKEIEEFSSTTSAEAEFRKDINGIIEDLRKSHKGEVIGAPIPESFIDLGKYLFSFFLGALTSGITYDLIKTSVKKLLVSSKDKTQRKFEYFIISDGDNPNEFEENIYFYLPITLTDAEIDLCMDEIKKIIDATRGLGDVAYLGGSPRFYFVESSMRSYHKNKTFALREIKRSS